jgi:predicted RNase H-like nuclease (RuvC/YqgF family)
MKSILEQKWNVEKVDEYERLRARLRKAHERIRVSADRYHELKNEYKSELDNLRNLLNDERKNSNGLIRENAKLRNKLHEQKSELEILRGRDTETKKSCANCNWNIGDTTVIPQVDPHCLDNQQTITDESNRCPRWESKEADPDEPVPFVPALPSAETDASVAQC